MGIGITEYDKKGKEIVDDIEIEFGAGIEEQREHEVVEERNELDNKELEDTPVKDGQQELDDKELGNTSVKGGQQELDDKELEDASAKDEQQELDSKELKDEQDKENSLTEKCAALVIEPQPDGTVIAHGGHVHENEVNKDVEKELQPTQENVFKKDKIATFIEQFSIEGNNTFASSQAIASILNRAGVQFDQSKNIIIEEAGVKTVYFPNGEMMTIDANINDLGDMKFILDAKDPQELKDTIDQINARDNREKPMEMVQETQSRGVAELQQSDSGELTR